MKQIWLNEDKLLKKLHVRFSNELIEKIEDINWYNRSNTDALTEWHDYIDSLVSYISSPVIAWDNMNRYKHSANGKTRIKEPAYDVTFMVKTNKTTNQSYVFVVEVDLRPEYFGLNDPSLFEGVKQHNYSTKRVYRITETQLHTIVKKVIKEVILSA